MSSSAVAPETCIKSRDAAFAWKCALDREFSALPLRTATSADRMIDTSVASLSGGSEVSRRLCRVQLPFNSCAGHYRSAGLWVHPVRDRADFSSPLAVAFAAAEGMG